MITRTFKHLKLKLLSHPPKLVSVNKIKLEIYLAASRNFPKTYGIYTASLSLYLSPPICLEIRCHDRQEPYPRDNRMMKESWILAEFIKWDLHIVKSRAERTLFYQPKVEFPFKSNKTKFHERTKFLPQK